MARVAGKLLRLWRKSEGLTLEEVGKYRRPHAATKSQVGDVERDRYSMGEETLLEFIRALERASRARGGRLNFGKNSAAALSKFFGGPEKSSKRRSAVTAARAYADSLEDDEEP